MMLERPESAAQEAKRGLWVDPYPVLPWEWRKRNCEGPLMLWSKTDKKNIELSTLLYQLRAALEVELIIGLNIVALRNSEIGNALGGYLQKTAQESLALYFCKIFELPDGHSLNSIPGIIGPLPEDQITAYVGFGTK